MDEKTTPYLLARLCPIAWLRRSLIALIAVFLLYVLGGFLGVPLIFKYAVLGRLDKQMVGSFETDHVAFNPFTWKFEIEGFRGIDSKGETLISFSSFRVNLQPSSVFADDFVIREILLDQPKGVICLDEEGELNLVSLFGLVEPKPEPIEKRESRVRPSFVIERLEMRDAGLDLRVERSGDVFERELRGISFVMKDLRSNADHVNSYDFDMETHVGELLQLDGFMSFNPLRSNGTVVLEQLQLPDFAVLGGNALDADVVSGVMDLRMDYQFSPLAEQPELGVLNGELVVENLNLQREGGEEVLQRIDSLRISGMFLDVTGKAAGVDQVNLDGFHVTARRNAGGSISLPGLSDSGPGNPSGVKTSPEPKPLTAEGVVPDSESQKQPESNALREAAVALDWFVKSAATKGINSLAIKIGGIEAKNGGLSFTDNKVKPAARIGLSGISLSTGPLDSKGSENLNLQLACEMASPHSGGIQVSGLVSPRGPKAMTQLKIVLDEVSLSPFSPYAVGVIGRPVTAGTLSLDVDCSIKNGMLKASDEVVIRDIEIGPRDKESNAPKLPIKLAIAVLEDTHGVMTIEVPVEGNLNDPKFGFGRVVTYAIRNVITKVASAPFRMLGKILPGAKFDREFIAFDEGLAELSRKEQKYIDEIAQALRERPEIQVVLSPSYVSPEDREALADLRYEQAIEAEKKKCGSEKKAIENLYKDLPKDQRKSGWFLPEKKVMKEALRKSIQITDKDLETLAEQRAGVVRDRLQGAGVNGSRIRSAGPVEAKSARVNLSIELDE